MALDNAFPILILCVEFGTLHTVIPTLVAGLAGLIAIHLADAFVDELILHTVAVCGWEKAFPHFQFVAIQAVGAVVGEVASSAFWRTLIERMHPQCRADKKILSQSICGNPDD